MHIWKRPRFGAKVRNMKFKVNDQENIQKKVILLVLPILIIVALSVYYVTAGGKSGGPPKDFVEARQSVSAISKDIVNLNVQISNQIKAIQDAETAKNESKVLSLIGEAKQINSQSYKKAEDLSYGLENMTKSISGIPSSQSQELASEAVSTEITLADEFISYTQMLDNFFNLLSIAATSDSPALESDIKTSLGEINKKVDEINGLNQTFIQKMQVFDNSL